MSNKSDTTPRERGARDIARRSLAVALGTAVAVAAAAVAAWRADQGEEAVTFVVFGLATAPALVSGAWILLVDQTPEGPAHPEDTVEHTWLHRACTGAFVDLVVAMGLTVAVTSILATPEVPLVLFLLIGMSDAVIRYASLSRQES